jgi:DNA-binding NarL/FixJ family response regulator
MVSGDVFREPASIRQIASELVVTEAAVKQHLVRLYGKFGIVEREGRRARLANEAIRRGAVSTAEILRGVPKSTDP